MPSGALAALAASAPFGTHGASAAFGTHELLELNDTWVWRYHVKNKNKSYDDNCDVLCTFSTIQDFWRYYNNIPKPSEFFQIGDGVKKYINKKYIHSWSIFRKNIEPTWECSENKNGGEVNIRNFSSINQLNELWENAILVILGETLDFSNEITGLRVVDSSNSYKLMHRIEIWYSKKETEEKIKKHVHSDFLFPKNANIIYKLHS